jgi:hypothetical protein
LTGAEGGISPGQVFKPTVHQQQNKPQGGAAVDACKLHNHRHGAHMLAGIAAALCCVVLRFGGVHACERFFSLPITADRLAPSFNMPPLPPQIGAISVAIW